MRVHGTDLRLAHATGVRESVGESLTQRAEEVEACEAQIGRRPRSLVRMPRGGRQSRGADLCFWNSQKRTAHFGDFDVSHSAYSQSGPAERLGARWCKQVPEVQVAARDIAGPLHQPDSTARAARV